MTEEKLEELKRRLHNDCPDLDRAVYAFARWQGMTDEPELQRAVAKAELDTLIHRMEPEEWNGLRDRVEFLGEENSRKLMSYSLRRAMDDLQDLSREVRDLPDWSRDEPEDEESEGNPSLSRKRRRDREP
jgi:uncharacterized protein YqcC (DUF446 family)